MRNMTRFICCRGVVKSCWSYFFNASSFEVQQSLTRDFVDYFAQLLILSHTIVLKVRLNLH